MHRFQHILVDLALDGQELDLMRWAAHLVEMAGAERVTVVHSWENEDIPASLKKKYPWLVQPGAELLAERAKEKVSQGLGTLQGIAEVRVLEGERLATVLRAARDIEADLIVTMRKPQTDGGENYAARLCRKAPCSVICVESGMSAHYERVLVPVDYSEHSMRALDFGCALARARNLEEVRVLRCFAIPYGQHRAMISREDFKAECEAYERERLDALVEGNAPSDVRLSGEVIESPVAALGIASYAKRNNFDVVVLGSRGRHAASAAFLGSTAETVLREAPTSILVSKPKGTGVNLLDSLLT